jgi:hypothetical protein
MRERIIYGGHRYMPFVRDSPRVFHWAGLIWASNLSTSAHLSCADNILASIFLFFFFFEKKKSNYFLHVNKPFFCFLFFVFQRKEFKFHFTFILHHFFLHVYSLYKRKGDKIFELMTSTL